MAMLVRIEGPRDKNGNCRAGYLVLNYGNEPNIFHVDDQTKTVTEIQKMYNGIVKATIRVLPSEYNRLKDKAIIR